MGNYLVRVQLPDRPGALGAVASRIGAVGGDVVSIEILQHDGGAVIDEFGVALGSSDLLTLLQDEILEVDGVTVEAVRLVEGRLPDRNAEILRFATELFLVGTRSEVLDLLVTAAHSSLVGDFAAIVEPSRRQVRTSAGDLPEAGIPDAALDLTAPDDHVATVQLEQVGLVLVTERQGLVMRRRERLRLSTLAGLADHRCAALPAERAEGATSRT